MTLSIPPGRCCVLVPALFAMLVAPSTIVLGADQGRVELDADQRIALVGNSTAERMNLFGHFETRLQLRFAKSKPRFRNFGWPADEVSVRQRPGNYTEIDDPFLVFRPNLLVCFFGLNESFAGDNEAQLKKFVDDYQAFVAGEIKRLGEVGVDDPRFILVSPLAFESTGHRLQPGGVQENRRLSRYAEAVEQVASEGGHFFVDLFKPTSKLFAAEPSAQYTINGIHLNERGDAAVAEILDRALFGESDDEVGSEKLEQVRRVVNDKSWLHLQDYRMLNGWYVYGGRRTWDTETFPGEYKKIREMVAVRDRYLWDLCQGKPVPPQPDDSATGEVFIPETMFGSRDDNFREMREPKTLQYPTPEESISQMSVADGFRVELFASEREFPELANPTQMAFDNRGRLWVSCMENYPQWLPGSAKPNDRLLIFDDRDGDGRADSCKVFYDKLICPTGFEFYKDGVLVVDEPRILFLRDTDGDDIADQVVHLLDGIGTDDTHHAMGAWEYSPGGRLHMLEGIAMSTTLETPWGPRRQEGASGAYVWDLESQRIGHFRTPGQYNPWCLVFDKQGNGIIGDGTNAQQHWANALSGGEVRTRSSLDPIFDNHGIRPAAGNELLTSSHFPEQYHNQLVYGCVINMHGLPAFEIRNDPDSAGLVGERVGDLLTSTDMFFRPVDPKIGPDGALWFGDWCNALIGHMQYSQRDPNRDHEHGRIYRLRHVDRPLLQSVPLAELTIAELLDQLTVFETRTRYRARRELRARDRQDVLDTIDKWVGDHDDPAHWQEALWVQESFHAVDAKLVSRILASGDYAQRAAAIHVVGNQWRYLDDPNELLWIGARDDHPRVRMEAVRAASLQQSEDAVRIALEVTGAPLDKWIEYVLQHALQTLQPIWESSDAADLLAKLPEKAQAYLEEYKIARGPGADVYKPMKILADVDAEQADKDQALLQVVAAAHGDREKGKVVFSRVCAACHQRDGVGKKFGPDLTGIGDRMTKHDLIRSIVWPNDQIAKGFETVMVLDFDGTATSGFVMSEDDKEITLGIADGKTKTIAQDDIELRKEMKASSMPEGLTQTIAPKEFLDLLAFLSDGWIATNPNLDFNLQEYDGWTEVSRQSHVQLGEGFPPDLNQEATHLLSHEGVRQFTFAVHSPNKKVDDPAFVIRFNDPTSVHFVKIFNRRDATLHDRAKGLTMWTSVDGKDWQQAWHSEQAYPDWSFALPGTTPIRYVKFGLDRPGILHLDRVVFYGEVNSDTAVD